MIIKGGKERSDSSLIALKYIKKFNPDNVLIHDAARPNFTISLLKKLINSLKKNKAAIPVVSSKDSIKYKVKKQLYNLNRSNSYLTQTPQAFKFKEIYDLSIRQKSKIQDEATLFIDNNLKRKSYVYLVHHTSYDNSKNEGLRISVSEKKFSEKTGSKWEKIHFAFCEPQ